MPPDPPSAADESGTRPIAQRPVAQHPVIQHPVAQRPVIQRPVAERPGTEGPVAQHPIVLYDAHCAFCRWSLRRVLAWDRGDRLRPLALQDPAAERLLAPIAPDERMASWHLVLPGGEVRSGAAAAAPLLRLLPGGRPLAAVAAAFPRATNASYKLIAGNRSRLSRLVRALGRG